MALMFKRELRLHDQSWWPHHKLNLSIYWRGGVANIVISSCYAL